ncbi:MAG: hypothetical protein JNL64_02490 [Blastocatellia bacterium]|nr:hypothetical protein [Blastocatellia bacterium]
MRLISRQILHAIIVSVGAASIAAQANGDDSAKWQPVIGHQKEFVAFMPSGFKVHSDEKPRNFGTGRSDYVTAKKAIKVVRLINRRVLLWTFYEADGKGLFSILSKNLDLSPKEKGVAGAFEVRRFAGKIKTHYVQKHYFLGKDRLYELTAYSPYENDTLTSAFFASVRVLEGDSFLAPNAVAGDTSTGLPRIKEEAPEMEPNTVKIKDSDADRGAIIIFQPGFSVEGEREVGSGIATVTAVFDASGTVKDVKHSGTVSLEFRQAFAESVKGTVFIPAEKNGKLVSVERTFKNELNVEIRGAPPGAIIR